MNLKRIFLVAGESSGDILGSGLMEQLKILYQGQVEFEGIGGPLMLEQGLKEVYPMDRLSVMGIWAILKRYRELSAKRKALIAELVKNPPDCFIGIDAPEFNLDFELKLHQAGIKTVHYVSPSVWAWRPKRIFKIKQAVDLMLCLFTFEQKIYQEHLIPVVCTGHPLAEKIDLKQDLNANKQNLNITSNTKVLAVLPGSRGSEIKYITKPFLQAAKLCQLDDPRLKILLPCINETKKHQIESILASMESPPIVEISIGNSKQVMAAADAILIASGTATLEAALLKKPMVVGYKMSSFSYAIFSRMLKIKNVSLPNLLAGKTLVPELIQDQCSPENLYDAVRSILNDDKLSKELIDEFSLIHQSLKKGADKVSSKAVFDLLENQLC